MIFNNLSVYGTNDNSHTKKLAYRFIAGLFVIFLISFLVYFLTPKRLNKEELLEKIAGQIDAPLTQDQKTSMLEKMAENSVPVLSDGDKKALLEKMVSQ